MPDFDPTKTPGAFEPPPAHAPMEVSQPITPEAQARASMLASRNEQPLTPFNPQPTGPAPAILKSAVPPPTKLHAPAKPRPEIPHQPAASETDSPSRGIPMPEADPNKVITGGWGAGGAIGSEYFPLDGVELKELVRSLMDELNGRLDRDLRFQIAVTYPMARVRLVLEVEAYPDDRFDIEYVKDETAVLEPIRRIPLEIARQHCDKVCFVLMEQKREVSDDGVTENPPDRVREELGMAIPQKQRIQAGSGHEWVDIPTQHRF